MTAVEPTTSFADLSRIQKQIIELLGYNIDDDHIREIIIGVTEITIVMESPHNPFITERHIIEIRDGA